MDVLMRPCKAVSWSQSRGHIVRYCNYPERLNTNSSNEAQDDSANVGMIQWYTRRKGKACINCLEVASLEEGFYPRLVPALDHDMVCESVNDTLGIRHIQLHL
jgi:hypothetical protein